MSIKSKAIIVGKLIGVSALFLILTPAMVFVAVVGVGGHSPQTDIEQRRKWTVQQLQMEGCYLNVNS